MIEYEVVENHPNLMCDELKDIYFDINDKIIIYHRLPFRLFETSRTIGRQKYLKEKGYTKTMDSKHIPNTFGKCEAFDVVMYMNNKPTWDNKYKYYYDFLGTSVLEKWNDKIRWGGNFLGFYDGCHFELK